MNRPRIQQQPNLVISVRGIIVFSREEKTITNYFSRRISFFKTRDKVNVVKNISVELISFNFGCAKAIQEFKQSKKL